MDKIKRSMMAFRFSPIFFSLLLILIFGVTNVYRQYFASPEPRDLVFLKCESDDYEDAALLLWDRLNYELASISNPLHWKTVKLPLDNPDFFAEHYFFFQETWADAETRIIRVKECGIQCFEIDRVSLEATMKTIGRQDSAFNCESIVESDATKLYSQQVDEHIAEEAAKAQAKQNEVDAFEI